MGNHLIYFPSPLFSCGSQRKDFPSNSFYVVVVVKTEDEACGGPLRFYPLRPDELIDAGNRSKTLDVVVSPAISCESLSQAGQTVHHSQCSREKCSCLSLFPFLFLSNISSSIVSFSLFPLSLHPLSPSQRMCT